MTRALTIRRVAGALDLDCHDSALVSGLRSDAGVDCAR